jgi:hypothetical protein
VFPDGIIYDREKGNCRTFKTNQVFTAIASLQRVLAKNDKGQITNKSDLSCCVVLTEQISNHETKLLFKELYFKNHEVITWKLLKGLV